MQSIARIMASVLLALATCAGAVALVGCGGSSSQGAASASAQSAQSEAAGASAESADDEAASDEASDGEQDNCYGDDLPAKKS